MPKTKWRLNLKLVLLIFIAQIQISEAVKCFDCVGMDCMGSFCEGDYCMISQYAPRWGSARWGEPEIVKGCAKGSMLTKDVRDHCEFAEDSDEPFTCFCNGKDLCNSRKTIRKVEREDVELVQCVCNGAHCRNDKTCIGELCTFVKNHKTKQVEQGCTNASVPLIERRAIGSCMAPPITGAMHHVAKEAESLLAVESCICGTDYCNSEKPSISVPEKEKCNALVEVTTMGTTTRSENISCTGEFCFTASIKSKLGVMSSYRIYGCASFTGEDALPEELDPTGCAIFTSESLETKTCFKTSDRAAVGRALASKQIPESKASKPSKGKSSKSKPKQVEVEYDDEEEEEEEEKAEKPKGKSPKNREKAAEEAKKEEKIKEEEEEEEEREEEEKEKEEKEETSTKKSFIFQKPTQPPIPDDSNTTMITVFVLIIICILGSGIVWKFELHKKLRRSNYDSVAGG